MKIKSLLLLTAIIFVTVPFSYSQCVQTVWEDNFDGASLNTGLWTYDLGDGSGTPAGAGWGNAELQNYTNSANNIKLESGNLVITAVHSGGNYTSAKIKSTAVTNGYLKYGRVEARMKLPSATSVWPAFWMLPKTGSWPDAGEIDIMEASNKNPTKTQSTIHYAYPAGARQFTTSILNTVDLSLDFHKYAMEWTENEIRFYFDDELYLTVSPEVTTGNAWPFNNEFYIILNVAVGGPNTPFTGNISPIAGEYPSSLVVDYVKVESGPLSTAINGDSKVYQGSTKTYSIVSIAGATYNWSAPQGASIQSGQGTNSVEVQFDNTLNANLTCSIGNACGTNDYLKLIEVEEPFLIKKTYEDFETNRNVTYGTATGTLQQAIDNTAPGGTNSSTKIGKYVRNASEVYDVIQLKNVTVEQAGLYATQQRRIHLDVNTNAPIGTKIRIQFESEAISTPINYPYGRHSVYDAYTTVQNGWETLEFDYVNSPDANLVSTDIDLFTLLIDPENTTGYTVSFDNLIFGQAGADPVYETDVIFHDFDANINMVKNTASTTGNYSIVANPASNAVNSSVNSLQYIRKSSETYDVLSFDQVKGLTDASLYKSGTNVFFMDINTNAPIGTPIVIQLENSATATPANFPLGRNSKYSGVTTKQNEWETIQFSFAATLDVTTPNVTVDQFVVLIDAGKNTGNTYYIDNIRSGKSNASEAIWVIDQVYEDFDGTNLLTYNKSDGTYDGKVANQFIGGLNTSANVGKYNRNGAATYDALFFDNVSIGDASLFRKGEKRFALDVYANLAPGTLVNVQLEDKNVSTPSNFPSGRHSYYQGVIKETNGWHTIDFIYTASPDPAVTNANQNTTSFLFAPNSSIAQTIYFDNFRSYKKITDPNAPRLSLSVNALSIAAPEASTKTFDITSLNTSWGITSNQSWLTFSSSSGNVTTVNSTITLTASQNTIARTRKAILTITATGLASKTLTVTQEAAPDLEAPTAFTATKGAVGFNSVVLLLSALDNSDQLVYTINYGSNGLTVSGSSGIQKTVTVTGLSSLTDYAFSISAKDPTGNVFVSNPILVNATTTSDEQAPTLFTAVKGAVTSNSVEVLLNATDNSGKVVYSITYGAITLTVNGISGVLKTYKITSLAGSTNYAFNVIAKDEKGNAALNNPIVVTATTSAAASGNECFGKAVESTEGNPFLLGYKFTFATVGSNVVATFELIDAKVGLVAFLFNRTNGFAETQMTNTSGNLFSTSIANQTNGTILTLACKFAYAGGLSVTRDFDYTVGNTCASSPALALSANSLTILAENGSTKTFDIQSNTNWTIASDQNWIAISTVSGVNNAKITLTATGNPTTSNRIANLTISGANVPIETITLTQLGAVITTDCAGAATQSQQGDAFTIGYKYSFSTSGTNVTANFELLDAKEGLVAFLWNKTSGFSEVQMSNTSGQNFTKTITNQTVGATLSLACKFAYSNGLAVTKDISYVVGKVCEQITDTYSSSNTTIGLYPNPANTTLFFMGISQNANVVVFDLNGVVLIDKQVTSSQVDISQLKSGVYGIRIIEKNGVATQKFVKE
ncbi:MAG: family 16 glycosylhydrolase [Cytophagales bacterium]